MLTGWTPSHRRVACSTRPAAGGFRSARRLAALAAGAWLACALPACRGGASPARDSAAAPSTPAVAAVPSLPECPNRTGKWDECNVRQRLERAGLAPQPLPGPIRHPFLAVPGIGYRVGHAELQVFLYEDASALARDLAKVDTVRVQGPGAAVAWIATPSLITSNNMAAILLSDQATQIERVRLALTAGLPAPSPPK